MRIRGLNKTWLAVALLLMLGLGTWAVAQKASAGASAAASDNSQSSAGVPILVELFTSEGCSSCPPADTMLANLDRMQPVAGAQAIVLSEHVDYWNHDGWSDPYSSSALTERQEEYVRRFKLNDAFTPEMVVDGATQFNGSDAHAAVHALEEARGNPKVPVRITSYSLEEPKKLRVHVEAGALPAALGVGKADVLVAVALDHAESHVMRGENKGRDLKHVAVAVAINKVGIVEEGKGTGAERGGLSRDVVVKLPNAAELTNLRLIAFVQKPEGGAVLGATLVGGGKTGEAEAGGKAE